MISKIVNLLDENKIKWSYLGDCFLISQITPSQKATITDGLKEDCSFFVDGEGNFWIYPATQKNGSIRATHSDENSKDDIRQAEIKTDLPTINEKLKKHILKKFEGVFE